ncbi:helix-turn-helix transcriptional regulator [Leptothrix discophora]|uniref:Helix-turn-helix transcriptional regulator n=1 Tax=Leptothrix discophora TaxID=89 RepID=A0ABT9G4P5_LEPDI|nr:helix-turn-helix transcriptional regulator [Leptothrix discophora]MDP4301462.1 helix-turn-helix transcriptional regulator [Leptothrix discophora]
MSKILDHRPDCPAPFVDPVDRHPDVDMALAARLRAQLDAFANGLGREHWPLHRPASAGVARGEGHFHLAPELFLQVCGWTRFGLPHGAVRVGPGEALLMPARLLHHEQVGREPGGEPFCNVVLYADGSVLTCHVAHEHAPGTPGILYLEARQHAQAARALDWLSHAAEVPDVPEAAEAADWQVRALVIATLAGARRVLDEAGMPAARSEPAAVARLRMLIQNQLGDQDLSVRRLAEQSGVSADYLSHRFRLASGEHLVAYINRQRMERAARLLADTDMAVKEIAWACGYATPGYFIQSFRRHFGDTPGQWRSAHAQPAARVA